MKKHMGRRMGACLLTAALLAGNAALMTGCGKTTITVVNDLPQEFTREADELYAESTLTITDVKTTLEDDKLTVEAIGEWTEAGTQNANGKDADAGGMDLYVRVTGVKSGVVVYDDEFPEMSIVAGEVGEAYSAKTWDDITVGDSGEYRVEIYNGYTKYVDDETETSEDTSVEDE